MIFKSIISKLAHYSSSKRSIIRIRPRSVYEHYRSLKQAAVETDRMPKSKGS